MSLHTGIYSHYPTLTLSFALHIYTRFTHGTYNGYKTMDDMVSEGGEERRSVRIRAD